MHVLQVLPPRWLLNLDSQHGPGPCVERQSLQQYCFLIVEASVTTRQVRDPPDYNCFFVSYRHHIEQRDRR